MKNIFITKLTCFVLVIQLGLLPVPSTPASYSSSEPLLSKPITQQPEVNVSTKTTSTANLNSSASISAIPSGSLFSDAKALLQATTVQESVVTMAVQAATASILPTKPVLKSLGYSTLGKKAPYVGYGTIKLNDRNNISYRYDIGSGGQGSVLDIVMDGNGQLWNLSSPVTIGLKRVNSKVTSPGLSKLHAIFVDVNGVEITRDITLTGGDANGYVYPELNLVQSGFDATKVKKIVLRQGYADLNPVRIALDRSGEIFVNLNNVSDPPAISGGTYPAGDAAKARTDLGITTSGFIQNTGTVPGFINFLPSSTGLYGFRYDVGCSAGSTVKATIKNSIGANTLSLDQHVVIAMKNNGNGAKARVRFVDADGKTAEYVAALTGAYQEFDFNLGNALYYLQGSLDRTRIARIEIEINRTLSPVRNGEIDFHIIGAGTPLIQGGTYQAGYAADARTNFKIATSGFNKGPGTVPGYVTFLPSSAGLYGFRYDVGSAATAAVKATITDGSNPIALGNHFTMAMKNSGNGARARVRFVDANGKTAEYTAALTGDFQIFDFDLTNSLYYLQGSLDRTHISRVEIEIDRSLSSVRNGQINFHLIDLGYGLDPFNDFKPVIQSAGQGSKTVNFNAIAGAAVYQLQVATDSAFQNIASQSSPTTNQGQFTVSQSGIYYTRVRASKNASLAVGPLSQWSETVSFQWTEPVGVTITPSANLTSADITNLPNGMAGAIGVTSVGPGTGGEIDSVIWTPRGVQVNYSTGTGGWSGGGFAFDNFTTNPVIETGDISGLSQLTFGIKGDATTLKFEVVDVNGNKASVHLDGVQASTEQFWSIPVAQLTGIDLTRVKIIYFIVEGDNQQGHLYINRVPLLNANPNLHQANITSLPYGQLGVINLATVSPGIDGSTAQIEITDRGVKIAYATGTDGWVGGGFEYDSYETQTVETGDWSGLSQVVFGIKGNASAVKFEVSDGSGNKSIVYLSGIDSNVEKYWAIPTAQLRGIDLSHVNLIYFIVEGTSQQGNLYVNRFSTPQPLAPTLTPIPGLTASDITNLPNGTAGPMGITSVGPRIGGEMESVTATLRGVDVTYSTGTGGWAGGGLSYDDFTTTPFESGDISGLSNVVFGLRGDATTVKMELEDTSGNKATLYLSGVRSDVEQYWSLPTSVPMGVDLTHLRLVYFIVEGNSQQGHLYINRMPPCGPNANLHQSDITALPEGQAGPLGITSVGPRTGGEMETAIATDRGVEVTYATGTGGWAGAGFSYDDFSTPDPAIETGDIHGLNQMVFGIKGTASVVKFEVVDKSGKKSNLYLSGIRSDVEQFYAIPIAQLRGIDLTQVKLIYFIVEGANLQGTLDINRLATAPQPVVDIVPNASLTATDITNLPNGTALTIGVTSVGPQTGGETDRVIATSRGVQVDYSTGTGGWSGGGFSYDDFATQLITESGNISAISHLTFGVKGDVSTVKLELVDINGNKAFVRLNNVRSDIEQFWTIPLSRFAGVDLAHLRILYFIVEGNNQQGHLYINRIPIYAPNANLHQSDITALPEGQAGPLGITSVGPRTGNEMETPIATERGVEVTYSTGTGGWAGAGFSYDNFSTPDQVAIETGDIHGLNQMVFGIKGTASVVKFEVVDKFGKKSNLYLSGIRSDVEQFYAIPIAQLRGVDLTQVRLFYFIVEGDNLQGTLDVNRLAVVPQPVLDIGPSSALTAADITNLPMGTASSISVTSVGPQTGGETDTASWNARGVQVDYSTGIGGWAGGGFSYDDFTTQLVIESGNISALGQLTFGIKGDASRLKLELVDTNGSKASVHLDGVRSDIEQFWSIPMSRFAGVDLAHLRIIYFIVEGNNQQGHLYINRVPLASLKANLTSKDITNLPNGQAGAPGVTSVGPGTNGAQDFATPTARGAQIFYVTGTAGWAGGGFSYDNFQTTGIETGNLSGMSQLVFGIKSAAQNTPVTSVKFEVVDGQGKKTSLYLDGIRSDVMQYWSIPISLLTGIDLTQVRLIYFIVEGNNLNGQLFVDRIPTA